MRFEVGDDADDEGRTFQIGISLTDSLGAHVTEGVQSHVMSADDCVGGEFVDKAGEPRSGFAWESALQFAQPARNARIIGLAEKHTPDLGCVLDKFDIAIGVDFPVKGRKELNEVEFFDDVFGSERSPGFIESGSSGQVTGAGGGGCNKNSHRGKRVRFHRNSA